LIAYIADDRLRRLKRSTDLDRVVQSQNDYAGIKVKRF